MSSKNIAYLACKIIALSWMLLVLPISLLFLVLAVINSISMLSLGGFIFSIVVLCLILLPGIITWRRASGISDRMVAGIDTSVEWAIKPRDACRIAYASIALLIMLSALPFVLSSIHYAVTATAPTESDLFSTYSYGGSAMVQFLISAFVFVRADWLAQFSEKMIQSTKT